jgi:uncharacterized membrane protein
MNYHKQLNAQQPETRRDPSLRSGLRTPFSILLMLVVLAIAQFVYFYPQLPETVASHFDASGAPNGWMSKTAFLVIMGFVMILSVGSTAGITMLLPHLQDSMNISNKEYWLSPGRRDQTIAFIASHMLWIACAVLVLLIVINYFVFRMNIDGAKELQLPMIPTLATFIAVVGTIITRMILKFRQTSDHVQ